MVHPGGGGAPWRPVDPAGKAADGGPRGEANAGAVISGATWMEGPRGPRFQVKYRKSST